MSPNILIEFNNPQYALPYIEDLFTVTLILSSIQVSRYTTRNLQRGYRHQPTQACLETCSLFYLTMKNTPTKKQKNTS
jgi:hypothetical protein